MNHPDNELTAQPDVHFHPLYENLPSWITGASSVTRNAVKTARLQAPSWHGSAAPERLHALKTATSEHLTQRNRLEAMLANLKSAEDFAEPLLRAALKNRFGLDLDVRSTFLRLYIPQKIACFNIKSGAARTWTVSLLDAALHNFQASETQADAHEAASTFITQPSADGQFNTLSGIKRKLSIQRFTLLCRELDIGDQYEKYLNDNLGLSNPVSGALVKSNVIKTHQTALKAALQLAHIRQELPSDAYQAMLGLTQDGPRPQRDGQPLLAQHLTMMSSSLTGIVVFAPNLECSQRPSRIIVYIPDDPQHPLKQYADADAFITELTGKLRDPGYQAFFSRFVAHGERPFFFADLQRRLGRVTHHQTVPGDSLPSWRDTPIERPNLQFSVKPFHTDLWAELYQQQLSKLLNDARTLAVSTANADRTARWALWDALSKVASAILEVAAFVAMPFVPFLGEAMLAYLAYQMLDDSFEGIVDWAEGHSIEAFRHLMSLVETVVQVGTFAVGGAMVAGTFNRLMSGEAVAMVSDLKPVSSASGKTRYWRPDLAPYEHAADLPEAARPDSLGLYQHQGKTLLRLDDKLYAVEPDGQTGRFKMQHPDRAEAYQPALQHNNHGAWYTELENPLRWDRETVLRRLGPSVESFSTAEREQILRISGFHDNVLREIHVESDRPPSLLTDTIKRYKIDRDIEALINRADSDPGEKYQALNHRQLMFESRYRALEQTDDRAAQLLTDEINGLPTDIAQELADNASGTELMQLHDGHVPQRLKDVAVKAMEAVRAARAYEGFYLDEMDTTNTHRLALHSLESLPDWPDQLRIEVRDYVFDGALRDSLGQADAPHSITLVRADDGTYFAHGRSEPPADFYQTLLQALPQAQRSALNLAPEDGRAFKQRIAEHAAHRPELRTLFAKNPRRKPYYDPTTLRLPGGTQGYNRVGSTPTLNDRVLEVYPAMTGEELGNFVARLQRHPAGARTELSRLGNELKQLRLDLEQWVLETPTEHPISRLPMSELELLAAQRNRRQLAQDLQRTWRRESERDTLAPEGSDAYLLRLNGQIPGDLPTLTADFSHVSTLSIKGFGTTQGVPDFLRHFAGLRRLELRRIKLDQLPDAISQMTQLELLVLSDCGIHIDAVGWSTLSSMKKLQMLDLHRSQFASVPNIDSLPDLAHLDLSQCGLTEFPGGALQHHKLDALLLMSNDISELPPGLFESRVHDKRGVHLTDNPLSEQALDLIKQHYLGTGYDAGVLAPRADIDRVIALYPTMEVEQASEFVFELPGTLAAGRVALTQLEQEYAQLQIDLAAWTTDLPPVHPRTGEPFTAAEQSVEHAERDAFKQVL